ncbi:MAG TPA: chemotaxis protein CheW [Candidatus Macondimonas sp.]|nr:chemotaxis protein CheW [Candidatus Macondimonas sp.]
MNQLLAAAMTVRIGPYAALEAMESYCSGGSGTVDTPARTNHVPALIFAAANRKWALPQRWVAEVMRLPRRVRIPNAPEGLLGMVNLRGALVPVLDAGFLLGLHGGSGAETTVIVLRQGRQWVGLAVGQILGLQNFPAELRRDVPPSGLSPSARWLGVIGQHAGAPVGLVDWPMLLRLPHPAHTNAT